MLYENVRFGTICSVAFGIEDATQNAEDLRLSRDIDKSEELTEEVTTESVTDNSDIEDISEEIKEKPKKKTKTKETDSVSAQTFNKKK